MLDELGEGIQATIDRLAGQAERVEAIRQAARAYFNGTAAGVDSHDFRLPLVGPRSYQHLCGIPCHLETSIDRLWLEIDVSCSSGLHSLLARAERLVEVEASNLAAADREEWKRKDAIADWHKQREEMTPRWLRDTFGLRTPHQEPPPNLIRERESARERYWETWHRQHAADAYRVAAIVFSRRLRAKLADRSLSVADFDLGPSRPS